MTDLIPKVGVLNADQFVELLLKAEGIEPYEYSLRHNIEYEWLLEIFAKHMGAYEVDVSFFRY